MFYFFVLTFLVLPVVVDALWGATDKERAKDIFKEMGD